MKVITNASASSRGTAGVRSIDIRTQGSTAIDDIQFKVGGESDVAAATLALEAYPNPFNPTTSFSFVLAAQVHVRLTVYDMLGREVQSLVNGIRESGPHEISFDAGHLPSGSYMYRLETPAGTLTRHVLLLK